MRSDDGRQIDPSLFVRRVVIVVAPAGLAVLRRLRDMLLLILAAPLTFVVYVLVKRLYVRETLHAPASVPGEQRS